MKGWIIVILFAGVAAWLYVAGSRPVGDEGKFSIINDVQFNEVLEQARDSTEQAVFDFDSGHKLTLLQEQGLQKGEGLIVKLIAYRPQDFGPYLMLAKTQRALGKESDAIHNYKQALALIPGYSTDPSIVALNSEIKYDLSSYYFKTGDIVQAELLGDQAVVQTPNNAKYLSGAAQIKFALNKFAEARRLTDEAIKTGFDDPLAMRLDVKLKEAGY